MYNELFSAWQLETENPELSRLPSDFYTRLVNYLQNIDNVSKLLNEKNLKAALIEREATNAKRMAEELITIRYNKIIKRVIANHTVPMEMLATEEIQLYSNLSPSTDAYSRFAAALLAGQAVTITAASPAAKVEATQPINANIETKSASSVVESVPVVANKRVAVRFIKQVPAIIGADMKTYGPFMVEDVASVPESNAKILVRQGLAKLVEFP